MNNDGCGFRLPWIAESIMQENNSVILFSSSNWGTSTEEVVLLIIARMYPRFASVLIVSTASGKIVFMRDSRQSWLSLIAFLRINSCG